IGDCYHSVLDPTNHAVNGDLILKIFPISQNISVWINSERCLYLIGLEWKPGANVSILIFLGEDSARAKFISGHKELEDDQNTLILNHVKIWKPPVLQQLQYHCRDYQTRSGDGEFTRENGEMITGGREELMFSSQVKEKPPDKVKLF
ncbi:unnamed protein product, partial [Brassica oleracea]